MTGDGSFKFALGERSSAAPPGGAAAATSPEASIAATSWESVVSAVALIATAIIHVIANQVHLFVVGISIPLSMHMHPHWAPVSILSMLALAFIARPPGHSVGSHFGGSRVLHSSRHLRVEPPLRLTL